MPIIQRFLNCAIYINTRDHNPPHFHVRTNDGRDALVEIESFKIRSYDVRRRDISEALAWAADCRDLLLAKFKEYNP
jgi:hypothetical protein